MGDFFEIGTIVNTQGIKGEVRIIPSTDDISRYELLKEVTVFLNKKEIKLNIEKVWYHKQFVIIKFLEIKDMNEALKYKNAILRIPLELGIPLDEDEFYTRDLLDMKVISDEGEELGFINDVIVTGANDVYSVIKGIKGEKALLIPAIKKCIIKVDVQNKVMIVHLINGLKELNEVVEKKGRA